MLYKNRSVIQPIIISITDSNQFKKNNNTVMTQLYNTPVIRFTTEVNQLYNR